MSIGNLYKMGLLAIVVSIAMSLGVYIYNLKKDIKDYKELYNTEKAAHDNAKLKLAIKKGEIDNLLKSLDEQNDELAKLNESYHKASVELEKWKKLPPKVKYKTIYKKIYVKVSDVNLSKGDCEEGLKLNRIISNLDYRKDI